MAAGLLGADSNHTRGKEVRKGAVLGGGGGRKAAWFE